MKRVCPTKYQIQPHIRWYHAGITIDKSMEKIYEIYYLIFLESITVSSLCFFKGILVHFFKKVFLSSGISVLAECLDCPELKATADDFIHQHFTEVYKTDEFLQLDVKRVTHLLNQDTLTVRAEDQVTKLPSHNILSKNVPMDFLHFIFGYMIMKRIILGETVFTLNRVFQILFHGCCMLEKSRKWFLL